MAVFVYKARTKGGEKVEGTVEANDKRSASAQLERMGYIPVSIVDRGVAEAEGRKKAVLGPKFVLHRGKGRMSQREVLLFTSELSDLLASGMKLGTALNSLASRETGRASDKIITGLRDDIIRGTSLSDALAGYPESFTKLYISMIKAGEASGALDEVLKRLVEHYERVQETKEKVTMALVYPVIVLVLGFATLIFAVAFIMPKFKVIFEQMNQALPLPTRILLGATDFVTKYGWFAAIVIGIGCVMARRAVNTEKGRFWWDGMKLKIPLVKGVIASNIFANFASTLSTLMANGVPVLQALGIVEQTVGNVVISKEILNARNRVTDGTTISGPLAAGKVFPRIMTDMMSVGEQTGDMAGSLAHIGRRYSNELNRNLKIFTTALEPILIVLVAVVIGFVAISVLMAVFNMTNGLDA